MTNRVVFDTNVLISAALLKHSTPRKAVGFVISTGVLLLSETTVTEIKDVLFRPKFDRYIRYDDRLDFIHSLVQIAEVIQTTSLINYCPDTNDNKFLELAVDGNAQYIVSGDNDLLLMSPYRGISIVTPTDFLNIITL